MSEKVFESTPVILTPMSTGNVDLWLTMFILWSTTLC